MFNAMGVVSGGCSFGIKLILGPFYPTHRNCTGYRTDTDSNTNTFIWRYVRTKTIKVLPSDVVDNLAAGEFFYLNYDNWQQ